MQRGHREKETRATRSGFGVLRASTKKKKKKKKRKKKKNKMKTMEKKKGKGEGKKERNEGKRSSRPNVNGENGRARRQEIGEARNN